MGSDRSNRGAVASYTLTINPLESGVLMTDSMQSFVHDPHIFIQ